MKLSFLRFALLTVAAISGVLALCAREAPGPGNAKGGVTVDDVIRLSKAGVGEEIIIQQIRRKGPPADLTADQIIELKNASVSERIIRVMLEAPATPAAVPAQVPLAPTAPPASHSDSKAAAAGGARKLAASPKVASARPGESLPPVPGRPAAGSPPAPGAAGWTNHSDPMGFSLSHPAAWKVDTDPKLGRLSLQGDRGERVIIWPMFLEKRQLDDRQAGILVRQLAVKLDAQMPWSAPRVSGRFVVTGARTTQRKNAVMMTWANSQNGVSILLYSVAAPADSYGSETPAFAGVLQSFRIANAPAGAGGAPAKRAPLGAVQYVRWADPMENAFSLSVPQGWKVIGGMYRFSTTDIRPEMVMLAPGGGILIKLGQKDFGTYMEPIYTPMGNMTSGSLPQHDGSKIQIQAYLSGQQFARYYVEHVRQECGGVRVVTGNNRADLVPMVTRSAQEDGVPQPQVTVGDVTFTCNAQGTELRGYYLAATVRSPTDATRRGQGGAMWFVYRLGGYLAVPEWQQSAESIAQEVVRSVQVNSVWRARNKEASNQLVAEDIQHSQELQRRAFAAIAENQRQTSDLISRSYWEQQARYDEISRKRENGILGTVDVINPTTGESYKVQYNSNYYWMNDPGYMAGTLTHDAPAVGWQEAIQLP
ncbi:MAG TPA: hypothetical protein VMH81_15180 [Bryobacteraceae bacterium]|nr:hypothetical protein [Bryobacteraceae bacterium]